MSNLHIMAGSGGAAASFGLGFNDRLFADTTLADQRLTLGAHNVASVKGISAGGVNSYIQMTGLAQGDVQRATGATLELYRRLPEYMVPERLSQSAHFSIRRLFGMSVDDFTARFGNPRASDPHTFVAALREEMSRAGLPADALRHLKVPVSLGVLQPDGKKSYVPMNPLPQAGQDRVITECINGAPFAHLGPEYGVDLGIVEKTGYVADRQNHPGDRLLYVMNHPEPTQSVDWVKKYVTACLMGLFGIPYGLHPGVFAKSANEHLQAVRRGKYDKKALFVYPPKDKRMARMTTTREFDRVRYSFDAGQRMYDTSPAVEAFLHGERPPKKASGDDDPAKPRVMTASELLAAVAEEPDGLH